MRLQKKVGFDILFRLVYLISICIYDISSYSAVLGRKGSNSGWEVCRIMYVVLHHDLYWIYHASWSRTDVQSNVFLISCFLNDLKSL